MPSTNRRNDLEQNALPYLNVKTNWKSKKGDVRFLIRRLKENQQKQNKEKIILFLSVISIVLISGIIISF
jgi:hypothetical protein